MYLYYIIIIRLELLILFCMMMSGCLINFNGKQFSCLFYLIICHRHRPSFRYFECELKPKIATITTIIINKKKVNLQWSITHFVFFLTNILFICVQANFIPISLRWIGKHFFYLVTNSQFELSFRSTAFYYYIQNSLQF